MRKYTRWGESGERPKGWGEGPALQEKTDRESLHIKTVILEFIAKKLFGFKMRLKKRKNG